MNLESFKIVIAPVLSEKATRVADKNHQIVFKVMLGATKPAIKKAIEEIYGVKVDSVRTAVVKGKRRHFGRVSGRQNNWKKAYVELAEGYDIDFITAEAKG